MRKLVAISVATLFILFGIVANADDVVHTGACAHQQDSQKVTYECLEQVVDSLGEGTPGPAGPAGPAGPQGERGERGLPGKDGVVPGDWYKEMQQYIAATNAATAHLPMDKNDRITMGFARVSGRTGVGFGYARRFNDDNNATLSIALGASGQERVANATVGWEF